MAFPPALIDSLLHLEKVIESNRSESPSSPLQIGETVGNVFQLLMVNLLTLPCMLSLVLLSNLLIEVSEVLHFPLPFVLKSFVDSLLSLNVFVSSLREFLALFQYSNLEHLESEAYFAIKKILCRMCGALTLAAGSNTGRTS